jgi:hypothetical protein
LDKLVTACTGLAGPPIGEDNAAALDVVADERQKLASGTGLDNPEAHAPKLLPFLLLRHRHSDLVLGPTATLAAGLPADVKLISLDNTEELRAVLADHAGAQFLKPVRP